MASEWKSQTNRFKEKSYDASREALQFAASFAANEVRRGLASGYTTGAFNEGKVAESVTMSEPERRGNGWLVQVGTPLKYALAWEVGHMNVFTRRYERREIWRPAVFNNRDRIAEAFARAFKLGMDT